MKGWIKMSFNITTMQDKFNGEIRNISLDSAEDLYDMLSTPKVCEKGEAGAWIGGTHFFDELGKRKVTSRNVITLDIDHPQDGFKTRIHDVLKDWEYTRDATYCIHSTASASEDDQRCRLIIPLDREVNEKEYRIITSMIMADISPDDIRREKSEREFDWSCNETNRLMYMPSINHPDSFFLFESSDGHPLYADEVLDWFEYGIEYYSQYVAIHGTKEKKGPALKNSAPKSYSSTCCFDGVDYSGDPREKDSIVGSFCKVYDIEEAIYEFNLPYDYAGGNKWKYDVSSSPAGAIIDSSGLWFHSKHESDPACTGGILNAYDLVLKHKIANGEISKENAEREMYKFVMQIPEVKEIEQERARKYKAKYKK